MLSLHHQQQKQMEEVFSSWKLEREQSPSPESSSSSNSSLSCALENSMKIWQVSVLTSIKKIIGIASKTGCVLLVSLSLFFCISFSRFSQPTNGSGMGYHGDQCFGNALNLAWTDWAKPSGSLPNMQGIHRCHVLDSAFGFPVHYTFPVSFS